MSKTTKEIKLVTLSAATVKPLASGITSAFIGGRKINEAIDTCLKAIVKGIDVTSTKASIPAIIRESMKSAIVAAMKSTTGEARKAWQPGFNRESKDMPNGNVNYFNENKAIPFYANDKGEVVLVSTPAVKASSVSRWLLDYMKDNDATLAEAQNKWLASPVYHTNGKAVPKGEPVMIPASAPKVPMAKTTAKTVDSFNDQVVRIFCVTDDGKWASKAKIEAAIKLLDDRTVRAIRKVINS